MSSYVELKAGISMHPGHPAICAMLGVDEESILKEIKCPQMFMPAEDDNENVKLEVYFFTTKLQISRFSDLGFRGLLYLRYYKNCLLKTYSIIVGLIR